LISHTTDFDNDLSIFKDFANVFKTEGFSKTGEFFNIIMKQCKILGANFLQIGKTPS